MRINFVSFKGYDPYPVNGGKVEKLEYETKQGWNDSGSNDAVAEDIDAKKAKRDYENWLNIWTVATSAYDD